MGKAGRYNIYIEQGSDFERYVFLKKLDDSAIDLTGDTFVGQIRSKVTDPAAITQFRFDVADQTDPDLVGRVKMYLTAEDTLIFPMGRAPDQRRLIKKFVYDVVRVRADGSKMRILEGTIEVSAGVSR